MKQGYKWNTHTTTLLARALFWADLAWMISWGTPFSVLTTVCCFLFVQTVRKQLLLIKMPSHLMSPASHVPKLTADTAWQPSSSSDARPPNRTIGMGPKLSQKLGQPCWWAETYAKPQDLDIEILLIFRAGICGSLAHRKVTIGKKIT